MIQIFGTTKCKHTRAAQRFFAERRVPVVFVDLRERGLSAGELTNVARGVGGIRALYAASADDTVRYAAPTDTQLATLLVDRPALLVTPIVRRGPKAAAGHAPDRWTEFVAAEKA